MVSSARARGAAPKTPSAMPPAPCSKRRRDKLLTRSDINSSFVRGGGGDVAALAPPYRRSQSLPLYLTYYTEPFWAAICAQSAQQTPVIHVRRRPPRISQRDDAFCGDRQPRRAHRGAGCELFGARRRSGVADRAERLRQEHAAQYRLGADGAERGRRFRRRRARRRAERPCRLHAAEGFVAAM